MKEMIQIGVVGIRSGFSKSTIIANCPKCAELVIVDHLPQLCKCGIVLIKPRDAQDALEKIVKLSERNVVNIKTPVTASQFEQAAIGACPKCGRAVIIDFLPIVCKYKTWLKKSD